MPKLRGLALVLGAAAVISLAGPTAASQAADHTSQGPQVAAHAMTAVAQVQRAKFSPKVYITATPTTPVNRIIRRSGSYTASACSSNVSIFVHYQTCLTITGGGKYGNVIYYVQGKFAFLHTGRFRGLWVIEGQNPGTDTHWQWSGGGYYGTLGPTPWRGDTGKLKVGRQVQTGTRVWFIFYQLENGRWINVRSASILVY